MHINCWFAQLAFFLSIQFFTNEEVKMLRVDGIHIYYLNPFSSSIWNLSEILAGVSWPYGQMIHWAIYLGAVDGKWTCQQPKKWDAGSEIYSSVSRQRENMNKLWRSNSSESAAWMLSILRIAKKVALACRRWEPQNSRSTGFTLPELTRAEQTASPPPGMLVSQSLGIWISWWGFWLMSVILCYDLSVFYGIIYLRYELLCMLIQFIQRGSYTYRAI